MIVYKMIRNGVAVADVVTFDDGKCVIRWPTSATVYDSEDAARAVHIDHMGGRGEKTRFDVLWVSHPDIERGMSDCLQDSMENAPFASIGGLDARNNPQAPNYDAGKPIQDKAMYLLGYTTEARARYGADWRTCTFGWTPAMTIGGEA